MKNLDCPNCKEPTIPFWQKFMGPSAPAECSKCTALIATTWLGYLWPIVPFTIIWAISEFYVENKSLYWAMNVAGLIIWIWLTNQYAPLIIKEPPLPAKPNP